MEFTPPGFLKTNVELPFFCCCKAVLNFKDTGAIYFVMMMMMMMMMMIIIIIMSGKFTPAWFQQSTSQDKNISELQKLIKILKTT